MYHFLLSYHLHVSEKKKKKKLMNFDNYNVEIKQHDELVLYYTALLVKHVQKMTVMDVIIYYYVI